VLTLIVTLLLAQVDPQSETATAAQIEQAHQLLNGEWEIISYIDDGETLGAGLLRAKLAKDGRIVVSSRSFRVVDPETNETRITSFRVNPVKNPKQIELTTRDDRRLGGIYKFDGDDLTVCLEGYPDAGYPGAFDAPAGSNRRLIKLRMISPTTRSDAPAEVRAEAPNLGVVSAEKQAALATVATSRKPTESELTRVRDLFAGNWEITSIVDDGDKLGAALIRQRFAANGRIRFGTRTFAIVNPRTEERKVNSYRLDPTKTPSEIDVTTQFDSVLKGIYLFDGDKLSVCLAKNEDSDRPDRFEAPGGSGRLLVRMQLASESGPDQRAPQPGPSPEAEARERESKVRRMITGAWTLTDTRGTLTTVFQPDGGFVATRSWALGARRLFGPSSDSSNGSWSYRGGRLLAWVTSTTDPRIAGHEFSARVQTIGDDSMVVTDVYGSVKTLRRLR
jgi:uncharacterized protein (TIGR03067 family)